MRLFSTVQSVQSDEVTVLALIETFFAMGLAVIISIKWHTATHLVIGASLAPFLMLRTENSAKIGIAYFVKLIRWMDTPLLTNPKLSYRFLFKILLIPIKGFSWTIGPSAIKIAATLVCFYKNPSETILSIPHNWARIALSIDFLYPPELVPGAEDATEPEVKAWKWSYLWSMFWNKLTQGDLNIQMRIMGFLVMPLIIAFYIPAWVYRMSLKSTSLIYFPLIWVIQGSVSKSQNLIFVIAEIQKSQLERIKRWYALLIIFTTIVPFIKAIYLQNLIKQFPAKQLILYFFPIQEVDSWHVTRFGAAVITVILYFISDKLKIRNDISDLTENKSGIVKINLLRRIQKLMSLWTITCGLFLLYLSVDWSTFPRIRWLPF